MQHSPHATRSHTDKLDERLKEKVKCYRRYLQKISRLKTKILCALRDEGVSGGLRLCFKPRQEKPMPPDVAGALVATPSQTIRTMLHVP